MRNVRCMNLSDLLKDWKWHVEEKEVSGMTASFDLSNLVNRDVIFDMGGLRGGLDLGTETKNSVLNRGSLRFISIRHEDRSLDF